MINHNVECCDECKTHEDLLKIVNDNMPDEDELYDLAELFKVFGDLQEYVYFLYYLNLKYVYVIWQKL